MSKIETKIMEVVNDTYLDMCINDITEDAPYQILIRKDFNTACWSYKDKHRIFIGDKILERCKEKDDYSEYIASYLYHEVGHSLFTEKDLGSIKYALDLNTIPFSLWNLAEDARIEHLMREKSKRNFVWSEYEELREPLTPVDQLFYIIQNEGDREEIFDLEHNERVTEYYDRFCEAESSMDVVSILIEWIKEFKTTQDDMQDLQDKLNAQDGNGSQESGTRALEDLMQALELQDKSKLAEALSESKDINEEAHDTPDSLDVEVNTHPVDEYSNAKVSSRNSNEWDNAKAEDLSELFSSVFESKLGYINTKSKSDKLNKKAFRPYAHTTKFYQELQVEYPSAKKVTLVLDCSGSMNSSMSKMQIVIGVFNELAKARHLEGNIILSGVKHGTAIHETFKFPIENSVIGSFRAAYGAEGLNAAMSSNMSLLEESDYVFVLTDGRISDEPINREESHLKGIYTIGIYIGDPDRCQLNEWFDKGIAVKTVEDCADELVSYLGGNNA